MEIEIWKDILGYEGEYQVSNFGRVKSLKWGKERVLRPETDKNGYLIIGFSKDNYHKLFKIHRLVAQAFLPNPDKLSQVNHKDEDKANNTVENLEWCNCSYNINYGTRNQKLSKKCVCIETGVEYCSTMDAYRKTGVDSRRICDCCNGKKKQAGGYHWRYISD